MGDPYNVGIYINCLTPGGTLVIGPGHQGEPTMWDQMSLELDTLVFGTTMGNRVVTGLMLAGPNDFETHPPLGIGVKFQFPGIPGGITAESWSCGALVQGQLLYPGTVYQVEASP